MEGKITKASEKKWLQMPSGLHRWACAVGHVHLLFPLSSLTEEFEAGKETEAMALEKYTISIARGDLATVSPLNTPLGVRQSSPGR